MSTSSGTPTRLVAFAIGAVGVFVLALGLGKAVSPSTDDAQDGAHGDHGSAGQPAGTTYQLRPDRTAFNPGKQAFGFRVVDASGQPLTSYDVQHEKLLHLVVVRTDLGGYRHVHPVLDATTGQWSTDLDLGPGSWRAYADFAPTGGEKSVATADIDVAGDHTTSELGPDTDEADVDGFAVHLAREAGMLTLHVTRGGEEVTDLQPYLGAHGHLVAIRAEDLTYLHVHPQDGPAGPEVAFHADLGDTGRYRLFFEFKHGGTVHRAEFTVTATADGADMPSMDHGDMPMEEDGDEHNH